VNHLLDERALQADLVRTDWISSIAGLAGSRDPGATPLAQCPAAEITQATDLRQHRSADICRAVWRGTLDDRRAILTSIASTSESPPGANELRFLA
jgi:hypothetical protein